MKNFLRILGLFVGIGFLVFWGLNLVFADEINDEVVSEIYIKAVNPGFTIDGKSNVGEMIEIGRKDSDELISLAGIAISYTNSSGNKTILFEFPENSFMVGESILLRLASSPESELAAENYTKTLAFKGAIGLEFRGEVLDAVCWNGGEGCFREFKSSEPKSLVRNLESGEFEYVLDYVPKYEKDAYSVEEVLEEVLPSRCQGLEFSEILSYYEASRAEQFVEIYNAGSEQVLMDGCNIRYKNKLYGISGILGPEGYYVYRSEGLSLTKNPANKGVLELVDVNGDVVDKMEYLNGQRKGTAFAFIGYDELGRKIWRTTYAPTPGAANNYQEFKSCEEGKVINEATGNCVKVVSLMEKICPDGQYLNILTGRCRKYDEVVAKECKEGYELNPETNRCRKIKVNTGANYSLEPENYEEKSSFIALYAVGGVVGLGLIYLVFEFRAEILKLFRKAFRRVR